MSIKKTVIKSKQLEDYIIQPEHVSDSAKIEIINTKKSNVARIVENIFINPSSSQIEITDKVYGSVFRAQFSVEGWKEGVRTTGEENPVDALDEKGRGFENYKVWIRRSGSRLAFNNGLNNNEVFGELYAKEFIVNNFGDQSAEAKVSSIQNSDSVSLFNLQATSFDENDYVGGILTTWNGQNDNNDLDLGLIESISGIGCSRTIQLSESTTTTYSGIFKIVRYYLKFYTYDGSGNIIEFTFPSSNTIDILFVESLNFMYEEPNNMHNFMNFYKVLDYSSPSPTTFVERELTDTHIYTESAPGDPIDFITFEVPDGVYNEGTAEVFIDGIRIPRWNEGDDEGARRFKELNPGGGLIQILNFNSVNLLTEEVFIKYYIDESGS